MDISFDYNDLKRSFRDYLTCLNYDAAKANIICNYAFYLANYNLDISLIDFLTEKKSIDEYRQLLNGRFSLSGNTEVANAKAKEYTESLKLLINYYKNHYTLKADSEAKTEKIDEQKNHIDLLEYCNHIRINYSYKPVFILSMLENTDASGRVPIIMIINCFINFYSDRRKKGQIVEQPDSLFCREALSVNEVKNHLLANAAGVLEKDKIITITDEYFCFTEAVMFSIFDDKDKIISSCNVAIQRYYNRLASPKKVETNNDEEQELGLVLNKMYTTANKKEKVVMIHLFGVRYGELIDSHSLSISRILSHSGLKPSYYTELKKGIKLGKYVREK